MAELLNTVQIICLWCFQVAKDRGQTSLIRMAGASLPEDQGPRPFIPQKCDLKGVQGSHEQLPSAQGYSVQIARVAMGAQVCLLIDPFR